MLCLFVFTDGVLSEIYSCFPTDHMVGLSLPRAATARLNFPSSIALQFYFMAKIS